MVTDEGSTFGHGSEGGGGGEGSGDVSLSGILFAHCGWVVFVVIVGDEGVFPPFGGEEEVVSTLDGDA